MITQIDAKIFVALKNRLDAFTGAASYYGKDTPQNPPVDLPFLQADDLRLDFETRYVNGDVDEYRGIFNVAVMAPASWTTAQGYGLAGKVADHFPKTLKVTYGGATVDVLARPRIIGAPYQDRGMMRYPVQIKWRAVG